MTVVYDRPVGATPRVGLEGDSESDRVAEQPYGSGDAVVGG
jgi:hypothetical protein